MTWCESFLGGSDYNHPYYTLSHLYLLYVVVLSPSYVQHFMTPLMQHARLPCVSLSPWVCSNSCPLSQWHHPIITFSVAPFSSCPQSFPASGSFPMSQLFASGGQRIRASTSASVFPMSIQDWFPLGLTGLISLQSKGLSRVFSSTTVQSINSSALTVLYGPTHPRSDEVSRDHYSVVASCWDGRQRLGSGRPSMVHFPHQGLNSGTEAQTMFLWVPLHHTEWRGCLQ